MIFFRITAYCFLISLLVIALGCTPFSPEATLPPQEQEWHYYHGLENNQYSPLNQINRENVDQLEVAWSHMFGHEEEPASVKCNPLVINGVLYGTTAAKNIIALDATTGEELWYFDFKSVDPSGQQSSGRGLHYWKKGDDRRLFYVYSQYLYAIDASTGTLIDSFGQQGRIPYSTGLERDTTQRVTLTTPGVIYQDLLILGSSVSEFLPAAPGHIRAFDVVSGELAWVFHTIPQPGEFGYDTWPEDAYQTLGGANCWAGMSLDEGRGIVYVPTASPTYDFYGANRTGMNLFANCLLALDAATGERIWHHQLVHHDLWDRDLPCPPNLITVTHQGKPVDVVAQATKQGYVYVFNRETGEPLFDIEEVPVAASTLPGEEAWPTQPVPVKPPPFARQDFSEAGITNISSEAEAYVTEALASRPTEPFAPPSEDGIIVMPFFNGGANWGGAAYDAESELLYINANDMPWLLELTDLQEVLSAETVDGSQLYAAHCSSCHGKQKEGGHYVPALTNIDRKYSFTQMMYIINRGRGLMPAMQHIPEDQKTAITAYLLELNPDNMGNLASTELSAKVDDPEEVYKLRYTNRGYTRFNDQEGYPAVKPPWGTLNAIDLNRGEIRWQVVLGEYPELTERGIPPTGTRNQGGPIVTAGGLIFIGATQDNFFRAFDKTTGQVVWEHELPGPGYATPATYSVNGKQYVVIAVTGQEESGFAGKYIAFALPDE